MSRSFVCIALVSFLVTSFGLATSASAQIVRGDAVIGEPFGVGRVVLLGGTAPIVNPHSNPQIGIEETNRRVFYPTYAAGPMRQLVRQFIQPAGMTVYFLFQGDEPLDITVHTPEPVRVRITPRRSARGRFEIQTWWREYLNSAELHRRDGEFPTLVDAYLTSMLSQRLRLPITEPRPPLINFDVDLGENIGLLLGTEGNQQRVIRQVMETTATDVATDTPLPAAGQIPVAKIPAVAGEIRIEPLAAHVPEECFYLRTGDYANYVWMQTTLEEYGGDIARMMSHRSFEQKINEKTQNQLGLKETALSRMLGGTLISDVAIIGTDMFFREGPAMGILFEARNNFLLGNNLSGQRQEAKAKYENAVEETVEIGGKKVSFIHTPDNQLRSFYVVDGDYHLVTTSRYIVKRFLEAGAGKRPLSKAPDFIYARSKMPEEREETIFVYLSDAFWRNLAGPQYRVESVRRNKSVASMQILEMARWAGWAEGTDTSKISNLVKAGFLPTGFGSVPDGGKIVVGKDADGALTYTDALRGARGTFLPVPDVKIAGVTATEASEYRQFLSDYNNAGARLDPVAIGIRRYKTDQPKLEEVVIEAHVLPLSSRNWDSLTRFLGPATKQRLARLSSDLVRLDVVSSGVSNNYFFWGLEQFNAPLMVRNGRVSWSLPNLNTSRGYLGGAPNLGRMEQLLNLLDLMPRNANPRGGYSQLLMGLWRFRSPEMTVLSFNRAVLDRVIPQFRWIEAERPAQIRLHVGDISNTTLRGAGNALGYQRAIDVSNGNAVFLHELHNQLHVPLKDARGVAELLVGAKLDCPLNGDYEFVKAGGTASRAQWRSTAATSLRSFDDIPSEYEFPIQKWFRGLDAEVEAQPDQITLRAVVMMHRERTAPGGKAKPGLPAPPELLKTEPEPLDELQGEILPPPGKAPEELPGKPLVPEENLPDPNEELPPPSAEPNPRAPRGVELPGGVQLPFDLPFLPRQGVPPARPRPE